MTEFKLDAEWGQLFSKKAKQIVLESNQQMIAAIKDKNYRKAYACVQTALSMNPNNAIMQEFKALLAEKVHLDSYESGTDSDEDAPKLGPGPVPDEMSSEEVSGSDYESSDSDDDDGGSDAGGSDQGSSASSEAEPASAAKPEANGHGKPAQNGAAKQNGASAAAATGPSPTMVVSSSSYKTSREQRAAFRKVLADDLKHLKEIQIAQQLVEADPLLGA